MTGWAIVGLIAYFIIGVIVDKLITDGDELSGIWALWPIAVIILIAIACERSLNTFGNWVVTNIKKYIASKEK